MSEVGLSGDAVAAFHRDGFIFPIEALSEAEAAQTLSACRRYAAVAEKAGGRLSVHRWHPKIHLVSTWADELVHNPRVLDAVQSLIGPDVMVWATQVFNRKASAGISLGWHQDAVYYGLAGVRGHAVRVWIALTPTTRENGTMCFSRGSHRLGITAHGHRSCDVQQRMLGEEVLIDIDPATEVPVLLRAGQASMHTMEIAHCSGVNTSGADRINFAIDFLAPSVEPLGMADSALLVRGADQYGYFQPETRPQQDFGSVELAEFYRATGMRHRRISRILQEHRDQVGAGAH